jgi:hypothetical protein
VPSNATVRSLFTGSGAKRQPPQVSKVGVTSGESLDLCQDMKGRSYELDRYTIRMGHDGAAHTR